MSETDTIYRLRTGIEEAVRLSLESQEFSVFTRSNAPAEFQKVRPRLEIKAMIGAATGRRVVLPNGTMKFDAWHFQLALQVVTAPQSAEANNQLHEQMLARARFVCSSIAQVSWNDFENFPNLYIAEPLKDSGTDSVLHSEDGVEYSTLGYEGIVCVRNTAWPN